MLSDFDGLEFTGVVGAASAKCCNSVNVGKPRGDLSPTEGSRRLHINDYPNSFPGMEVIRGPSAPFQYRNFPEINAGLTWNRNLTFPSYFVVSWINQILRNTLTSVSQESYRALL